MGDIDIAKNLGKLGQNLVVYHLIPLEPESYGTMTYTRCIRRSRLLLSLCFCRGGLDLFLSNDDLSISYLPAD